MLSNRFPAWQRESGACPACVLDVVAEAAATSRTESLQHELQLPYPVYAQAEAALLPTPVRLQAHPGYTGKRVTIAFLDSGFYPHPDLVRPRDRIVRYVDATESEPSERPYNTQPRVDKWHGTMTSCVGAGNGFMADGIYASLARDANVLLVKTGNTRSRRIHDRDIARALDWVIANQTRYHVGVINISLGGDIPAGDELSDLDRLVEEATELGMVVVAAAGNGGAHVMHSPAAAPSAITVGGLDDQNTLDRSHWRLYNSDFGRGAAGVAKPDVIAPARWLAAPMLLTTETHNEGMFLWQLLQANDKQFERTLESTMARDFFKQRTLRLPIGEIRGLIRGRMIEQKFIHAHYQHVDGTSFAAPIASSLAAQMLEANPTLAPRQVKQIICGSARPLAGAPAEPQGHGVIHAARAVAGALRAPHGALAGLPPTASVAPWGVSFCYHDDQAHEVALIGGFNGWNGKSNPMLEVRPGVWQLTMGTPPPGVYPYKFLVNHQQWVTDPENGDVTADGYGGYHSLLHV
jgi:serine protease AprX